MSQFSGFVDPYTQITWNAHTARYFEPQNRIEIGYPIAFHHHALQNALQTHLKLPLPPTITCNITARQSQNAQKKIPRVKNIIAIAANKGGVGKSTVTALLAHALARAGASVALLDADLYGPNIPHLFDIHEQAIIDDAGYRPVRAHGVDVLSMGLLVKPETPLVWRGPMASRYYLQMLEHTLWQDVDYLLIDMPPGTGDVMLSLTQKTSITGVVLVTTPHRLALADTQKGIAMLEKIHMPPLGLIENMAGFYCDQCNALNTLYADPGINAILASHSIDHLGKLPMHKHIAETPLAHHPVIRQHVNTLAIKLAARIAQKPRHPRGTFPQIVAE